MAHSTSQLPVPQDSGLEGIVYTSSLNYEMHTEDRGNRRGRRPQVDFTMSAHVDSDTFYCVPVEAKQKLEARDIRSTRQHSCRGIMRKYISVGMLVDEITFSHGATMMAYQFQLRNGDRGH